MAGNFRGVQFSRKASLQSFCGLTFADVHTHAHYTLYNRAYFAGLIFADSSLSAKTTKIGPHKNFRLYSKSYHRQQSCNRKGSYNEIWLSQMISLPQEFNIAISNSVSLTNQIQGLLNPYRWLRSHANAVMETNQIQALYGLVGACHKTSS